MDVSKAFDCLSHDLLLAKFEAYGLGRDALPARAISTNENKC